LPLLTSGLQGHTNHDHVDASISQCTSVYSHPCPIDSPLIYILADCLYNSLHSIRLRQTSCCFTLPTVWNSSLPVNIQSSSSSQATRVYFKDFLHSTALPLFLSPPLPSIPLLSLLFPTSSHLLSHPIPFPTLLSPTVRSRFF